MSAIITTFVLVLVSIFGRRLASIKLESFRLLNFRTSHEVTGEVYFFLFSISNAPP